MVHPIVEKQPLQGHAKEGEPFPSAELVLVNIWQEFPRRIKLERGVTRIGLLPTCHVQLAHPSHISVSGKSVRHGELEVTRSRDGRHRVLISVHPRVRYTLVLNRVRVFDSQSSTAVTSGIDQQRHLRAERRQPQGADGLLHPGATSNSNDEPDDEPGVSWTSDVLKHGDDVFCWWSSNDGGNAVCRFLYMNTQAKGTSEKTPTDQGTPHPFTTIPEELQLKILSKLPAHELQATVAPISMYFFNLCHSQSLWKSLHLSSMFMERWAVAEVLHGSVSAKSIGSNLQHLTVSHCQWLSCEEILGAVKSCPKLETFVLSYRGGRSPKLLGWKLRALSGSCRKLQKLVFEKVSFSGFEDCGIMANLETLGLRICSISGRKIDFSRFAKSFPVLTELAMGSGISFDFTGPKSETDVAKLMLSKLQKLYFHQATFDGLHPKLPLGALKNLTSLTIESAAKLTSQDLQEIATLPLLTSLGLTRCTCDDPGAHLSPGDWLDFVCSCSCAPRLQILKLRRASSVDDDVLVAIAQHFTVLKSLDITECTRVTDTGVAAVVTNCLQLESLEAGENDQLRGTDWLDRLLQARPRFQHLAVPGTLCESAVPEDLKLKTNTLSRKENDLFL